MPKWESVNPGYETKIVQVGDCTVRIHRPILDEKEKAKRENQVIDAIRGLMRERNKK
jgi:hypothetical protein